NTGSATAADIEELGEDVRRRVFAASGVTLEWEIHRIGKPLPPAGEVVVPSAMGENDRDGTQNVGTNDRVLLRSPSPPALTRLASLRFATRPHSMGEVL